VLAHRGDANIELENQGVFDELVLDDWLHVEQMDDAVWWLRVGDARLIVTLREGASPILDVERGFYAVSNGATKTRE
jgi:hypothetical protein